MRIATTKTNVRDLLALLANEAPETEVTFGKPTKAKTKNACWCGCGGETGGKFVPGHDSKFHSLAKQVARGTATMPETFVNEDAQADCESHVAKERPLHEAKVAAKEATDADKAEAKAEAKATGKYWGRLPSRWQLSEWPRLQTSSFPCSRTMMARCALISLMPSLNSAAAKDLKLSKPSSRASTTDGTLSKRWN